jgi:hypothetical protein
MAYTARRIYLEDPKEPAAATPLLPPGDGNDLRKGIRRLALTFLMATFVVALLYVSHYDQAARRALRKHQLETELLQIRHECDRLQHKLEAITSDGVVTARVKAHGYDYPDVAHTHTTVVAELPWEAEARAQQNVVEHPSVITTLRESLAETLRKVLQQPVAGTSVP